jgi:hypothetical protein
MLTYRYESSGFVQSSVDRVFAHIDDYTRLSSHMSKPSWKMGGGQMEIELDEGRGQQVGSRVRLAGRVFGVALSLEEIVRERNPPHRKVWETTGAPRLLVIGHYRMGFELTPQGNSSALRVFIDYALPERAPTRWLGRQRVQSGSGLYIAIKRGVESCRGAAITHQLSSCALPRDRTGE